MAGLVALCFQSAYAHTYLSSVFLNDKLLEEGDCVRPHPSTAFDSPIPLVTSPDMTCGWLPQANQAANRKCPIAAGSTIGIQWHHTSNSPSDDIVDPTHVGPIIMYLAKSDSGAGNVWFKIFEDGYSNGKWGVDRMLDKKGRVDFKIPADIAPGNYLLRGEIIALHGAYALNGVQPYVGCVELTISSSGTANPSGVAFPGYYKNDDAGMLFNRYQGFTSYPIPGPALYKAGSAPSSSSGASTPSTAPTTAPTSAPTSAPPPTAPTSRPSNGNIQVSLNSRSTEWWIGVIVSGGGETTVKVEFTDSGSFKSWTALADQSYAYTYEPKTQIKSPISIRLTSSSYKQVVLENVFTSFSSGNVDTGKTYSSGGSGSTTPAPTNPPTTKPTPTPTTPARPTNAPSSSSKVTIYATSTVWWFAVSVSGGASKVEVKDSGRVTLYTDMTANDWGDIVYTYTPQGSELVTPISVRVTNSAGKTTVATVTSITSNAVYNLQ